MSLTEIARFADLVEAQVAASRLRAEGVPVLVQNEHWGASDYLMSIAMGGFRLWTPDVDADEARRLIAELRGGESAPDAAPPGRAASTAKAGAALALAATFGPTAGLLLGGKGRGGWMRPVAVGVAGLCLAVGLAAWAVVLLG
ncbi:hypothetical protein CFHF_11970 [Caulobacter flavus]|jgi:hypothetical protein|uniref:DUF2007 domain-containing protein n=1 Tax=Caulobacter flavus TaxID=1679497 RepID=A0A2N5CU08_9CAUL|nr:DUF2007 domain-containing protein [Caulobacter flavus]AYV45750.1 hypothetical protein C1707_05510 [Caulobacter flavus]PLR15807.1 hypothetical protein CFHF_11970 [Caulobacter flavus]